MTRLRYLFVALLVVAGVAGPTAKPIAAEPLPPAECNISFTPSVWNINDPEPPAILSVGSSANFSGDERVLFGGPEFFFDLTGLFGSDAEEFLADLEADPFDPEIFPFISILDDALLYFQANGTIDGFEPEFEYPINTRVVVAEEASITPESELFGTLEGVLVVRITGDEICSATFRVVSYTTEGFFAPVDGNNVVNTIKGGASVPLKFRVNNGDTVVSDTAIVKSFTQQEYTCGTDTTFDAVEIVSTGGTALRYDATVQQFIQNWKTPRTKNKCYKVTVTLTDDQTITALFRTK